MDGSSRRAHRPSNFVSATSYIGQVRSGFSPVTSGPSMGTRALAKLGTRTIRPHGYRHTRYNHVCPARGDQSTKRFSPHAMPHAVCSLSHDE